MIKKIDYFIGFTAIFAFFLLLLENSAYLSRYQYAIYILNLGILLIFIIDIVLRFILSKDRVLYLKRNWIDLIVFISVINLIGMPENTSFAVIVRQVVIISMLISRLKSSKKLINLFSLKPAQLMITSFIFIIGSGAILLMLPAATKSGVKLSLLDALFTATSAACVTGLIVKDTAAYFSLFGQAVILLLIQMGGLGIMTFSVSLALMLKKNINMRQEVLMRDMIGHNTLVDIKSTLLFIFKMTIVFELAGALALFIIWEGKFVGILNTMYQALFHSVSAFCNAGFSIFSDNLMGFYNDIPTNIIICLLVISGGLGFMVIKDLTDNFRGRIDSKRAERIRFKMQTKIVLCTSVLLILLGGVSIYMLESNNSLAYMDTKSKITVSLFQSITSRTAGFNTIDIAKFYPPTVFFIIMLMFIGGSPGSTAGGVKTTTISILWAVICCGLSRKENVEMFKRTISVEIIKKAIIIFIVSLALLFVFTVLLLYTENQPLLQVIFEAASAFGTVGLSTGITSTLSPAGKGIITLLMFIGRLGPLTIAYGFLRQRKPARYLYAEESVNIG